MNTTQLDMQVIIIGGGLAGLVTACHLAQSNIDVLLVEKNEYPKHKVCGEYISKEVLPYLNYIGFDPFDFGAVHIDKFQLSTKKGKVINAKLPLGGFGISRYAMDKALFDLAIKHGVQIWQDTVTNIDLNTSDDTFTIKTKQSGDVRSSIVIGAYGKRSNLDQKLNRTFIYQRSPYLGVKAHYEGDFPADTVALHNFEGGYCGVSKVEEDRINICYLADYESFKKHKNLSVYQENVLFKNPRLKEIITNCTPIFTKPLTISQVSFLPKPTVDQHILMAGDSAGMIHPLCGNGMGMAIHGALLLSESIIEYIKGGATDRKKLESEYANKWEKTFRKRLVAGRLFNTFFSNHSILNLGMSAISYLPSMLPHLIRQSHGKPLEVKGT